MAPRKKAKRSFGGLRRLPSKRWQANYTAPDGIIYNAPMTFDTSQDAEEWLAGQRRLISADAWQPPGQKHARALTLGEYADAWIIDRPLKPRTRAHYKQVYEKHLAPTFGEMALKSISPEAVRRWHATTLVNKPTMRAHSYSLLRTILGSALNDRLIDVNPCYIRGAGNGKQAHKSEPATLAELETIVAKMPARYKVMALLAAWCAMRFGELAELRRGDIDLKNGRVKIRRAVVRVDGEMIVGTPKSDAGTRDVAIPPHLIPAIEAHLKDHTEPGRDALLFPAGHGGHMATSTLYKVYYPARKAAGRDDLRWHDLRHTGAVLAASTGATLAELMGRLGHSTPGAAMRYQHAAKGRDTEIAKMLSALVEPMGVK